MKEWAELKTTYSSNIAEILVAVVIGIALLQFLYHYCINLFNPHIETANQNTPIRFGSSLTVAS